MADIIRQNENLYLKKCRKCIVFFAYLYIKKLVHEIVPLWFKNCNQRAHMEGIIHREAYTWSNTSVGGKMGSHAGKLIGGEIQYFVPRQSEYVVQQTLFAANSFALHCEACSHV